MAARARRKRWSHKANLAKTVKYGDGSLRWRARLRKYGLTKEAFFTKLVEQEFKCPITGEPVDETSHVDHDHATGRVRSILSRNGNFLIGYLERYTHLIDTANAYIASYK